MEQGNKLLRAVRKNAEMGLGTIPEVLEVTGDPALRETLRRQLREYEDISGQAEQLLDRRGCDAGDNSEMRDFMSGVMVKVKTLADRSASHIAEMMIQGSTMGTIQITRHLHSCREADREACDLAHRLLETEENNIRQLKRYL